MLDEIKKADLRAQKALELSDYLEKELHDYAKVLGYFSIEDYDVIKVAVEAEIPQKKVCDIKTSESFYIAFDVSDVEQPRVLPVREDFPLVSHLDIHRNKIACISNKSLCLSNLEYSNRKLRWNPFSFIEDIRNWLSKTSINKLHEDDQTLEPFIIKTFQTLVISNEFVEKYCKEHFAKNLCFYSSKEYSPVDYLIFAVEGSEYLDQVQFQAFVFETPPVTHGIINKVPETFDDLNILLGQTGFDLISETRSTLRKFNSEIKKDFHILVILRVPKKRANDSDVEGYEIFAFAMLESKIGQIGCSLGVYGFDDETKEYGILLETDTSKNGSDIKIEYLNVIEPFAAKNALKYSDLNSDKLCDIKITAIGLGALGSQVFDKLHRSGIGKWGLIDKDILYPHNLSRHQLTGNYLGWPKVSAVCHQANRCLPQKDWLGVFHNDILNINSSENMRSMVNCSDVILDFSAAESITKFIAFYQESDARRISSYVFANSHLLVYMAENIDRTINLDYLEMCLYRQFLYVPELTKTILNNPVNKHRYGGTCGDISLSFSNSLMSMFAGLVAEKIKYSLRDSMACANISILKDDLSLENIEVEISNEVRVNFDEVDWKIVTDEIFITKVFKVRAEKLPNETGGVLVGYYDFVRKIIYVADFIMSPEDSKEWPTGYIRGCEGLIEEVNTVHTLSLGHYQYIGEWHSHPDGCSASPSSTDLKAMEYFKEHMDKASLPALMMIAGENKIEWVLK